MSKIDTVIIKNFRSVKLLKIKLDDLNVFVGKNNAGKTNLLRAIRWFCYPDEELKPDNFFDENKDIEICCRVVDIDDGKVNELKERLSTLGKCINNNCVWLRRVVHAPQELPSGMFSDLTETWYAEDRVKVDSSQLGWIRSTNVTEGDIRNILPEVFYLSTNSESFERENDRQEGNTFLNLISYVMRISGVDFNVDSKNRKDNVKLINNKKITDNIVCKLNKNLNDIIGNNLLQMQIVTVESDQKTGTNPVICFDEKNISRLPENFGQGLMRMAQMAVIKLLADIRNVKGQDSLLLIDEPEISLYPQIVEEVAQAIIDICSGRCFQSIICTHSPVFVRNPSLIFNTRIVKKHGGVTRIVPRKQDFCVIVNEKAAQYDIAINLENLSYALFADVVLLVEGQTEKIVLPKILKSMANIENLSVAVVDAMSCNNISGLRDILDGIGLTVFVVQDFDVLQKSCYSKFDGYAEFRLKLDDYAKKNNFTKGTLSARDLTGFLSDETNRNASRKIIDSLKREGIWVWPLGDIESVIYGRVVPNKDKVSEARNFIDKIVEEDCFKVIDNQGGSGRGMEDFCSWLTQGFHKQTESILL